MPFVFKVKYESTLRRMIVKETKDGTPDLTFKDLEAKIHDMFQIPINNRLVVTYMDQDKETVTMGGDVDLRDACIVQRIDPLRMEVNVQKTKLDGVDQKQVQQTKSLQSSSVGQSLVDAVKNSPYCSKTAALPDQLLSNDVESFPKVAEVQAAPYLTHKGVPFHKDVQCDGCTVVGPQFKSIRKEGDHLCLRCFTGCVDQIDHQRYENSTHSQRRHNRSMLHEGKMARYFNSQSTALALSPPQPTKVPAQKRCCPRHKHASRFNFNKGNHHSSKNLDARFVQHLTFPDGTEVFMGTHFTKSWRLRNTGSLPWPSATQLVCVGGDVLGSQKPSTLKIPYSGLLSGEEIDASVDLVAPGHPGRFVSYWRLMAPTGQKFGHRIWVVIQATSKPQGPQQLPEAGESLVEHSHKKFVGMEEPRQFVQSLGNDIKPSWVVSHKLARDVKENRQLTRSSGSDLESPAVITIHHGDEGAAPILDSLLLLTMDGRALMPLARGVNKDRHKRMGDPVLDPPRPMHTDAEHATDSNLVKSEAGAFSLVEKPDVNLVECGDLTIEPPSPSQLLAEPLNSESFQTTIDPGLDKQIERLEVAEDYELSDCHEDIILDMLNSMGFTQRTLNLELLRKNKNDMLGTVDDLVVASEWDHILDELEELGFYDADMNRRLLSKNNGSVKLVVKELLQMQTSWGGNKS